MYLAIRPFLTDLLRPFMPALKVKASRQASRRGGEQIPQGKLNLHCKFSLEYLGAVENAER